MAVDEAILEAVGAGKVPPTLRFFGWRPACLSLGRFQPASEVDWQACAADGIDVVRRPTGGSAILHDDELTYSIAAPVGNPNLRGEIPASYLTIAHVLVQALASVGIAAELAGVEPDNRSGGRRPAPCFVRPAGHEILVRGRKLIGSAQVRRAGGILQHGSIPLAGDMGAIADLLTVPAAGRAVLASQLRRHAISASEAADRAIGLDLLASAIVAALAEAWQVELAPGSLTEAEEVRAKDLESAKYGAEEWTRQPAVMATAGA